MFAKKFKNISIESVLKLSAEIISYEIQPDFPT